MGIGWWIAIAIGLGVIEVLTVDLIFIMLAVAALIAGVASLFGLGLIGQVIAFGITSALLLFLVRPWAKSFLARATPNIKTNAQRLVGQPAVVTELVTPAGGRVRLDGDIWSARSASGSISAGTTVTVLEIDGATAVVMPVPPNSDYQ
ncbi:MAG TPA: NfeD family protein [Actinomyces sp.]|jgi:membrane protein implicated in regulation of membrane protease activity|nr:NfeD family protein [Actinomyces sp.]